VPIIQRATEKEKVANPLDELSSADIAVHVAQLARLEETTAVRNDADSRSTKLEIIASDSQIIAKPQIVATKTATVDDIIQYVVLEGDTLSSLAEKFNVSSDSIRWSNDLGSQLEVGKTIVIPPIEGIVYTFSKGDSSKDLAEKYRTTEERIISFNDAEIDGFEEGDQIVIPGGRIQAPPTPQYAYTAVNLTPVYGGNGYAFGNCTWYASNRRAELGRPVPSNLGNARTWGVRAAASGLSAPFGVPIVGAVAVTNSGYPYGHIAIVEKINEDGSIWLSEMNYYGQAYAAMDTSQPTRGGFNRKSFRLLPANVARSIQYVH